MLLFLNTLNKKKGYKTLFAIALSPPPFTVNEQIQVTNKLIKLFLSLHILAATIFLNHVFVTTKEKSWTTC